MKMKINKLEALFTLLSQVKRKGFLIAFGIPMYLIGAFSEIYVTEMRVSLVFWILFFTISAVERLVILFSSQTTALLPKFRKYHIQGFLLLESILIGLPVVLRFIAGFPVLPLLSLLLVVVGLFTWGCCNFPSDKDRISVNFVFLLNLMVAAYSVFLLLNFKTVLTPSENGVQMWYAPSFYIFIILGGLSIGLILLTCRYLSTAPSESFQMMRNIPRWLNGKAGSSIKKKAPWSINIIMPQFLSPLFGPFRGISFFSILNWSAVLLLLFSISLIGWIYTFNTPIAFVYIYFFNAGLLAHRFSRNLYLLEELWLRAAVKTRREFTGKVIKAFLLENFFNALGITFLLVVICLTNTIFVHSLAQYIPLIICGFAIHVLMAAVMLFSYGDNKYKKIFSFNAAIFSIGLVGFIVASEGYDSFLMNAFTSVPFLAGSFLLSVYLLIEAFKKWRNVEYNFPVPEKRSGEYL